MNKWRNVISVIEVIIMLVCVILLIAYFASKSGKGNDEANYSVKDINGTIKQDYALEYLNKETLIEKDEQVGSRKMLTAAAMTYVASVVSTLLQVLRLILIARDRD